MAKKPKKRTKTKKEENQMAFEVVAKITEHDVAKASGSNHRGTDYRDTEATTYFHQFRRAPELDYADEYATIHPFDECFFKEDRQPAVFGCDSFYALRLLPCASNASRNASNGGGCFRPRLDA
jgi:hypothetical protein